MGYRWIAMGTLAMLLTCSCGPQNRSSAADVGSSQSLHMGNVQHVVSTSYDPGHHTIQVTTRAAAVSPRSGGHGTEQLIDVGDPTGLTNYVTSLFPQRSIQRIRWVQQGVQGVKVIPVGDGLSKPAGGGPPVDSRAPMLSAGAGFAMSIPPQGVTMDPSIHAKAGPSASRTAKVQAVLDVARSKIGTPYIWGHNEDRGEYGFDCSNYTAYVYHHALGYSMSCISKDQYLHVGRRIATADMSPGDLLIFEDGKHVGIFIGGGRMIQCGGGLGQVGYMSILGGSYWGNHLTAVKRLF